MRAYVWRQSRKRCTTRFPSVCTSSFQGTWGEACRQSLERLLCGTESIQRRAHILIRVVPREGWCWHLIHVWYSHDATAYPAEVRVASGISVLEHVHDSTNETVAFFDELAFAGQVERLEKQTETSLHENLIAVEAEGEAEFAFIEELDNLHNVFTGITNGYDSRRRSVAKIGNNSWTVHQSPDVVICKRLALLVLRHLASCRLYIPKSENGC